MEKFRDRKDADRRLADEKMSSYRNDPRTIILGLARGGVAVAAEMAGRLNAPLDVLVIRKLGVPGHPELAMGALASGGVRILNDNIIDRLGIGAQEIDKVNVVEKEELNRREETYRGMSPPLNLDEKTAILAEERISGLGGIIRIENKLAVVSSGKTADETVAEDAVAALERNVLVNEDKSDGGGEQRKGYPFGNSTQPDRATIGRKQRLPH